MITEEISEFGYRFHHLLETNELYLLIYPQKSEDFSPKYTVLFYLIYRGMASCQLLYASSQESQFYLLFSGSSKHLLQIINKVFLGLGEKNVLIKGRVYSYTKKVVNFLMGSWECFTFNNYSEEGGQKESFSWCAQENLGTVAQL